MATKKIDPNKPLPADASIQEQVDYWTARVNEAGTGTKGRLAKESLAVAQKALAEEQATTNPNPTETGGGTTTPQDYAAQNKTDAAKTETASRTPDVQPTTSAGSPVTTSTPTPTPTTTASTASSTSSASQSTTGGTYKTVKGVMQYQDNPFTGEYQGKYYSNGKIETPAQIKADFLANYSEQAKFIASVPELGNLLSTAISQNWSPTRWATEFTNTQWAQQHPGDSGLAEIKRVSAPEQYNTDYNAAYSKAVTLANQLGVKLTPQQLGAQVTDIKQTPGAVDQNAVNSGQDVTTWILQHPGASDQQITQFMAQHGTLDPQAKGGTIAAQSTQLAQLAQQYGVYGQYSPDGKDTSFFDKYALNMAQGAVGYDPNTAEQQFKTAAMNTYKPFADQIAGGAKVSDLASPYVNTLSSLLEVNPADIQLGATTGYGAMIGKALMGDGTAPVDPYTFASQIRSQPEWLNTQNAHSTLLSAGNQLIAKMGF